MNKDTGSYRMTPLGMLTVKFGVEQAEVIARRIESYLSRHYGSPSAIVFDGEGLSFSKLESTNSDGGD